MSQFLVFGHILVSCCTVCFWVVVFSLVGCRYNCIPELLSSTYWIVVVCEADCCADWSPFVVSSIPGVSFVLDASFMSGGSSPLSSSLSSLDIFSMCLGRGNSITQTKMTGVPFETLDADRLVKLVTAVQPARGTHDNLFPTSKSSISFITTLQKQTDKCSEISANSPYNNVRPMKNNSSFPYVLYFFCFFVFF